MYRADVSVIIPYFNNELTIRRAVESVVNQTLLPQEIIIVNDCSREDETLFRIEKEYGHKIRITLLKTECNSGPATARNMAWEKATGEYIAFLDADDSWHPQKIELQYLFMQEHPDVDFSGHQIKECLNNKNIYYDEIESAGFVPINPKRALFFHAIGGTPTVMIKTSLPYKFVEKKRYAEDYLLWLEIVLNGKGFVSDKQLAFCYKKLYGSSGLSKNICEMEMGEIETFYILMRKKYISEIVFLFASIFSLIKFLRRCSVIVWRENT